MYLIGGSKGIRVSRGDRGSAAPERDRSENTRGGLLPKRRCVRVSRAWSLGAPFVAPNLEHVAPKLALGYLGEVLNLPGELAVQIRRLKACRWGRGRGENGVSGRAGILVAMLEKSRARPTKTRVWDSCTGPRLRP